MYKISRRDARRVAVRAQLLDATRSTSVLDVVRGLSLLQIDTTKAVAPNAELVLWSRLGSAYPFSGLEEACQQRAVFEFRGLIRPAEDIALYRAEMASWPSDGALTPWQRQKARWVTANDSFRRDLLARLTESGPMLSSDLPDTCVSPWRSTGWNNDRNIGQMLEMLEERGEVAVACRRNGKRLWDLASRILPDHPTIAADEARYLRNERRLHSLGLARARGPECRVEPEGVGDAGEPAAIEGVRGQWRVDPSYLDYAYHGRTALLSPLDRVIYDRKRMAEIFEFDYALEMFKPKTKRRWGYFALPILHGDRFVGKVDATADRKAGILRIDAIHEDTTFSKALHKHVMREIQDLARWLELDLSIAK